MNSRLKPGRRPEARRDQTITRTREPRRLGGVGEAGRGGGGIELTDINRDD
jgi:hypothetical protein